MKGKSGPTEPKDPYLWLEEIDGPRQLQWVRRMNSSDHKVEVSRKIKAEYENGREYYKYHGNRTVTFPAKEIDRPSKEFIDWHNREIYKG